MIKQQPQDLEEKIAEIGGIQLFQPLLIGAIEFGAFALRKGKGLAARNLGWRQATILPAVDQAGQLARGPAILVEPGAFDHLLHEPKLIVGIEDRETRFQPDQLGMAAQDLDANGMECAEPRHALDRTTDQAADSVLHFVGGLVGEGHGEDLPAPRPARAQDVGNARCQHARLAGAGASQDQHRPIDGLDGGTLLGIELGHIRGAQSAQSASGDGAL